MKIKIGKYQFEGDPLIYHQATTYKKASLHKLESVISNIASAYGPPIGPMSGGIYLFDFWVEQEKESEYQKIKSDGMQHVVFTS